MRHDGRKRRFDGNHGGGGDSKRHRHNREEFHDESEGHHGGGGRRRDVGRNEGGGRHHSQNMDFGPSLAVRQDTMDQFAGDIIDEDSTFEGLGHALDVAERSGFNDAPKRWNEQEKFQARRGRHNRNLPRNQNNGHHQYSMGGVEITKEFDDEDDEPRYDRQMSPEPDDGMRYDGPPPEVNADEWWESQGAEQFTCFFTSKFVFSNHRKCNKLLIDGKPYICTEHYYMWAKAMVFGDDKSAKAILKERDPKTMKRLGSSKNIDGYDADVWTTPGQWAMMLCNWEKYKQNRAHRMALLRTYGTTLVECNPSDERWGIGLPLADRRCHDRSKWQGENWLGELLTNIRRWLWTCPDFERDVRQVRREIRKQEAQYDN